MGGATGRSTFSILLAQDLAVAPILITGTALGVTPLVATTAGGPREFVWHDVNGFLVDASAGGMAHGIGSLLADHDHCRALGANGRRAVEEKFNWDNVAAYTEGVYQVVAR